MTIQLFLWFNIIYCSEHLWEEKNILFFPGYFWLRSNCQADQQVQAHTMLWSKTKGWSHRWFVIVTCSALKGELRVVSS